MGITIVRFSLTLLRYRLCCNLPLLLFDTPS